MTVLRRTRLTLHRVARRAYHASRPKKLTIGIRREDPQRIWERRCPVSPEAVAKLVQTEDVDVLVQDCERRVWSSKEFVEVSDAIMSIDYGPHCSTGRRVLESTLLSHLPTLPLVSRSRLYTKCWLTQYPHLTMDLQSCCLGLISCSHIPPRDNCTIWNCCPSSLFLRMPRIYQRD